MPWSIVVNYPKSANPYLVSKNKAKKASRNCYVHFKIAFMNNTITTDPGFTKLLRTIGTNLHALRLAQDQKIEMVAKAVKVSSRLLQKIEKGEYNIEIETLDRLCVFYKVAVRDVVRERKKTT